MLDWAIREVIAGLLAALVATEPAADPAQSAAV
jgi:hypothetical protein